MIARLRASTALVAIAGGAALGAAQGCSGSAFQGDGDDEGTAGGGGSSGTSTGGSSGNGGSAGTSSGRGGEGGEGDAGSSSVCDGFCENSGRCVETTSGSASCDCAPGFDGERCERNIDDCSPDPCENGGTCRDGLDAFTCRCEPGFTGQRCENAGSVCEPNPCRNGALCVETLDGFHCDCADGFSGDDCSTNVDDCAPNPCENGGICRDGVDAYLCECPDGFAGPKCDVDVDDCEPNPCENGGTCSQSGGSGVTCDCPAAFTGRLCERTRFIDVLAGETHSCALAGDGAVTCWGNDAFGQANATAELLDSIADGAERNSCGLAGNVPVCWEAGPGVPEGSYRSVSGGAWNLNCGVTTDGEIRCSGDNADITDDLPTTSGFVSVTLGYYFGCALDSEGVATCFGNNLYGQVTNTPKNDRFRMIDAGYWRACGIRTSGTIACWGLPSGAVPSGTYSAVSVGIEHACALTTQGELRCWEDKEHADDRATPPDGTFLAVSAGGGHSCALRDDHGVVCWGENEYGQVDATPGF
jgi:Notch-like protein